MLEVKFVVPASFRQSEVTQWDNLLDKVHTPPKSALLKKGEVIGFASKGGDQIRFLFSPQIARVGAQDRRVFMTRTFRVKGGNLRQNPELLFKYAVQLGVDVASLKKRVLAHVRESLKVEQQRKKAA